jgi:hypothetical protein
VRGKEAILFRLAEAAVAHPDDTVRTALFPVVGEKTLRELVREAKANEHAFQARVRTPPLLAALEFGCHNTAYRPVMQALALLARYAGVDGMTRFFADTDTVPIDGVVPRAWREAVVDDRGRVERIPYELCVLVALRDALRRREIYVAGAHRWRDPDDDLPGDFDTTREVHYAAVRQPTDPTAFITDLRARVTTALAGLDAALVSGTAGGVAITIRRGEPWISIPKLTALPEPGNLAAVKDEVIRRWGTLDLLDVLEDADFLTEFSTEFNSVASREVIDRDTLRRRLLLCLFALGTNMGIKAIVATGEHGETEAALRHVRRPWHVERRSVCIYSQLKSCSSSEVAAMIEGLLRHCTDTDIGTSYVDTHGASVVGFAFTELLGFRLLPRLKNIGSIRLYRPDDQHCHATLGPVLTRPIRWELIAQQYDQMIRYATALRLGTAESEQVLRRSPAAGPNTPPTPPWKNSAGPYAPSSPATTSPTPSCAGRSTAGYRSWRTGIPATP